MGNQTSKKRSSGGQKEKGDSVGDAQTCRGKDELGIPGNSPLARLLLHWEQVKVQDFQTPGEMVRMCTEVWPQLDIDPRCPKFGSYMFEDIKRVDDEYVKHPPRSAYVDSWMWFVIKTCGGVRLAVRRTLEEEKLQGSEMSKFNPLEFLSQPPPTAPPLAPAQGPLDPPPRYEDRDDGTVGERREGGERGLGDEEERLSEASTVAYPSPSRALAPSFKGVEDRIDRPNKELRELLKDQERWGSASTQKKNPEAEGGEGATKMLPLRQVPMGDGIGYVEVPLTSTDLRIIKQQLPQLSEDPLGFVQGMGDALGPSVYTPSEFFHICQQLAGVTYTNQALIKARQLWKDGNGQRTDAEATAAFHERTPADWNIQTLEGREKCDEFRKYMLLAFENIVPKNISVTKAFGQPQGKDESPVEYLERLRKNMRQYTGLDPDQPNNEQILKLQFVAGSCPDIKIKLQKFDGMLVKPIGELLTEAQRVVLRREDEKEKKKVKLMVQTVNQVLTQKEQGRSSSRPPWSGQGQGGWRGSRARGRGGYGNQGDRQANWGAQGRGASQQGQRRPLPRDVCAACGQSGHWKRECPQRKGKETEELVRMAACYEDSE